MIDGHRAALGEGDAVSHLDAVLHNLDKVGHIIILLQCRKDSLRRFYIAIQLVTQRLQLLDTLLVITKLFPDFIQVGA